MRTGRATHNQQQLSQSSSQVRVDIFFSHKEKMNPEGRKRRFDFVFLSIRTQELGLGPNWGYTIVFDGEGINSSQVTLVLPVSYLDTLPDIMQNAVKRRWKTELLSPRVLSLSRP